MENEKMKNQKISDNDSENIAGGLRFHVDNTQDYARMDTVYLNKKEYSAYKKAGIIGADNVFDTGKLAKVFENPSAFKALVPVINNNDTSLTGDKPKRGEITAKVADSEFIETLKSLKS